MADKTAADLQLDAIKRGAAVHVRHCQLLVNAVERAGTGKLHHDDKAAHANVKRAYRRMMEGEA